MYIKFLMADGRGPYSGKPWSLPTDDAPGEWMPEMPVRLCESGYHVATEANAIDWIAATAYEVELAGEIIAGDNKVAAPQARLLRRLNWDDRTARLFAADCAEDVLPIYEAACPGDDRPRAAIAAARAYAHGEINAAAWDAARSAAKAAAWDAAGGAAWDAAVDAAVGAAWGAAWNAARDAAWAAAGDATLASVAAARAAAKDTMMDAAWDATRRQQNARLLRYLLGEVQP